ncbi:MAG: ester cyclase [Pseudomonadota bacterium]
MSAWSATHTGLALFVAFFWGLSVSAHAAETETERRNKAQALAFYNDVWFSRNTDRAEQYFAAEYTIHDIGDDKGLLEPASTQREIAEFWWANGDMSGEVDYQIADGDLVATRWTWQYEPTTQLGRILKGRDDLPIINVFRFDEGKIVEVWNHRHDIDTGMPLRFKLEGLGYGLLVALVLTVWALVLRRRLRRQTPASG